MAGTSNIRWFFLLSILFATLSCIKEESLEQPVDGGEERFAEFDPVVRFGLDTYMGAAGDNDPLTKTTYAGDDKTIVLDNVRYERINWNVWNSSLLTKPEDPKYPDAIQIISQTNFTPHNNKTSVNYYVEEISGFTNPGDNSREDRADAKPVSSGDNFYWSRPDGSANDAKHYFYAVYPTPESSVRPSTKVTRFDLDTSDSDPANHVAYIEGSINKRDDSDLEASREQKYLDRISYTDGLLGNGQTCHEYLPDMKNAYLYAASAMPGADAGYKKVPLRFKPLYSAVKLIVTARDAGAKNYRLKRVDLRTDLHNNGSKEGRRDLNDAGVGTALGGSFSTYFKADASSGTTSDFAKIDNPSDSKTAYGDTLKRLYIEIDPADRIVLGDDALKLTFLVLPIEQKVMTVDYTFEYMKDDAKGWGDPSNVAELHRYLSLQNKTNQPDNKGLHNEFSDKDWYTLDPATKLYVRSNVPEIQYYFDVVAQGNFPRTWRAGSDIIPSGEFLAKDFYAVISYRDSSGVLQPLRWKVTGYKPEGAGGFSPDNTTGWLKLRGDDPWTKLAPFDVDDSKHPGHNSGGEWGSFDPWTAPQGQGTSMKDEVYDPKTGSLIGYGSFNKYSFTYYDAAALNNDDSYARGWDWDNHASYSYKDPEGFYTFRESHTPISSAWTGDADEAIAFDLSSHDIRGNLYTGLKNGDLGTTANCYVVATPGWYRFPAVYGNAIKGGLDNPRAYNKDVPNDPTSGIMGAYLDHMNQEIKDPWIPYDIKSVSVVWEDATSLVSERKDDATRMDRRPFCETIDGNHQYIYFYVDDIAQGNALVAAKDASGAIVWSWHIWAVTKPVEYLTTIELQSNQTVLDPYNPLEGISRSTVMPNGYNFSAYPSTTSPPLQFPFAKKSSVKNVFWKTANLGQNGRESNKDPRYCDVEFTQYFKGKVVAKLVRRFFQSGVYDYNSLTPVYQWGRKDPLPDPANPVQLTEVEIGNQYTGRTIQHPTDYYYGPATIPITGVRYDNLWNNNITTAVTDSRCNNPLAPGGTLQFPGGSQDRNVAKTIYDPSPAGYVMPNMYAFSGLNPYGTIEQTRYPAQKIDSIAYNARSTFKEDGTGYIDFYAHYDAGAAYKRKKDSSKTIRIFVSGRLNGTNADGVRTQKNLIYLWTSEPGIWNGYYGRSLCAQNSLPTSGSWNFNPVTGVSRQELSDPSDPTSPLTPNITTQGAQAKWQRSHGEPVRPMVEQP